MSSSSARRNQSSGANATEILLVIFICALFLAMSVSFIYQLTSIKPLNRPDPQSPGDTSEINDNRSLRQQPSSGQPPHFDPPIPPLPIFAPIPNAESLISATLSGHPTLGGVAAILQKFLWALHRSNVDLDAKKASETTIMNRFYDLYEEHLRPFDAAYRGRSIFPIREDESIFLSVAAFREHLLDYTLENAFNNAKNPDKIFVGAVVQNCFGKVDYETGSVDSSGLPCRTGAVVVGKNAKGKDMTKVSDAPSDVNGIEKFCTNPGYKKYCDAGQIRVLYVHESESLGPAMARYYASKLWGGETYFMQTDSHLQFATHWDEKFQAEAKAARSFPKVVLSSYPPGFTADELNKTVAESPGARLCTCMTKKEDPNPIVRINCGVSYRGDEPRPTQIPFIAAGFFFARAEFLIDVPFDPLMPWCFMGEEMALSMRAWTSGWNIYAPRKNFISHQYRPGRLGLPKFWGSAGRVFHRPQLTNRIQQPVIQRVKHLIGYKSASLEVIKEQKLERVLTDSDFYGLGRERTWQEFMDFARMNATETQLKCHKIPWCNKGELE